ncbi:DeoR/GlpR family DNA-binding transcription regulator [Clostridium sp.]|uniref:DeoR/GlpR family DNA-binding transcription regulator n=1 Tax=Clostridium sp. TaxID=1506 RepID=UPI003F356E9F
MSDQIFMEERLDKILEIIKNEGKVLVKELSEIFNVSEGMIRKDLKKLEGTGIVKRTYGGAILERKILHNENLTSRVITDIDEKEEVAKKALNCIEDEDIIFLDTASTNYTLATMLANINKRVTVITNMNRIASLFDKNSLVDVICIGGSYNKKLGATVGASAIEEIKKFRVDKAFIGVAGVNIKNNFVSNFNLEEANTKKAIIASSKKSYLLMGNEKFYVDGAFKFSGLEDIDYIITDEKPEDSIEELLKKYSLEIIY